MATAAPAPPAAASLPSVLKIMPGDMKIPEPEATEEYHVGTKASCPFQNVTLGGVSFPRFTGGAAVGDPQRPGARVRLSASQIERIKGAVGKKVCRWRTLRDGDKVGVVMNTDQMGFRPQVGDDWLARHVYCVQIAPEVARIMDAEPEAMA